MSKQRSPGATSRGKMTVLVFQLEGSDETLQEGFNTIRSAIDRIVVPSRTITTRPPPAIANGAAGTEVDEFVNDAADGGDVEQSDVDLAVSPRVKRSRRPEPTPKILNDLGFETGDIPFAEFAAQKKPRTHFEKYAVIGSWLQRNEKATEISTDHIYTCYRLMDWTMPDGPGDTFRKVKALKAWFDKGSKSGEWEITIVGLNAVDKIPSSKEQ